MDPRLAFAARFAALAGLAGGLALAPLARNVDPPLAVAAAVVAVGALTATRPRRPRVGPLGALWLGLVAISAAVAGLGIGSARLAAIDRGALDLAAGADVRVSGFVAAAPRRGEGEVRVQVETSAGRVMIEASEPVPDLPVGGEVTATGTIREAGDWERPYLARLGIRDVLAATRIETTRERRGGIVGWLDRIRGRAEAALGRGTSGPAASLLRGFVLGQDDRIDAETVDEFKASGLAHLLAVSGQNVVLLGLLAGAVLTALGVSLRARIIWTLALIALYVPVAGAGPSIQRAGVMGAAGLVAALASRPRSRWYAVLLAAAATLALNPRASGDVGWQLSFAAVVGILACAGRVQALAAGREAESRSPARRLFAEGVALTLAATLATAPLMAHHFGAVSVAALPANLVALPAVAPVMWLGMLAGAAGQLAWMPIEPVTALAGALAGFIAQAAEWFASPDWAQVELETGGVWGIVVTYVALAIGLAVAVSALGRRRALRPKREGRRGVVGAAAIGAIVVVLVAGGLIAGAGLPGVGGQATRAPGLRVTVLDVGQGDAILLDPRAGDPILVDAGPASANVAERLDELGVDGLAALMITHPQDDHAGGAPAVLEHLDVGRLIEAKAEPAARAAARVAGTPTVQVATGATLRAGGGLRIEVLWPPRELLAAGVRGGDPNRLSLVLLARWRRFEILLCGDAEAELAPVDPGPIEVLKVAHHGSADAGLATLVERTTPELAVISVGDENPYGHPAPETLADLSAEDVPYLRTDHDGEVVIEVRGHRWAVR